MAITLYVIFATVIGRYNRLGKIESDRLRHSVTQVLLCSQQKLLVGASGMSLLYLDCNSKARLRAVVGPNSCLGPRQTIAPSKDNPPPWTL